MTKEKLLALGLTEQQVKSVLEGFKGYVPKNELNGEFVEKRKMGEVNERDKQVENSKAYVKDIEALKGQIVLLQEENRAKDVMYKAEIDKLKIDNAIDLAIVKANGKNAKAIKALLDFTTIKINEDGSITGIDKQIKKLVESEDSSFLFGENSEVIKGAMPSNKASRGYDGITKEQFHKMSYKERVELFNTNPELHNRLLGVR